MLSVLIRPLNSTQNDLCAIDKNTKFNMSKNLLRKVGISNSLCSRTLKFTIFKRQIKAKGTHTPNPWFAFPAHFVGELPCGLPANNSRKCRVELALASAGKGLLYTSLPRSLTDGYTMLMCSSNGETAVHGCHCPRDMAVRMREVMARPWAGLVYVCPLLNLLVTRDPPSPCMSW